MKWLGNLFLLAVCGVIGLFLIGCVWSLKIDGKRDTDAYSYYYQQITTATGDELDEASLAIGFLSMTGELTDEQESELQAIYNARNG